jgi:predicted permease
VLNELAPSIRRLVQARGFTFVCVLTLALGIGGTTAVFTLVQQVLLARLPVARPSELYRLGDDAQCCVNGGLQNAWSLFSYELYRSLRDTLPQFTELAAFQAHPNPVSVRRKSADPAEAFAGQFVSGNYFQTFGVGAALGRPLASSDDHPDAMPVAVVSYRAWQRRFGADPRLMGQPVAINGVASVIVGVAPAAFYGEMLRPDPPDFWIPLSSEPLLEPQSRLVAAPGSHWLYVIGRLRPGAKAAEAQNQAAATVRQWLMASADVAPEDRKRIPQVTVRLSSAAAGVANIRNEVGPSLRLLFAIAVATLLIACANLANLLLARGLGRQVEFAVRTALGASRPRLVTGTLIESVLLSLCGAAAGLLVSYAGAHAIVAMTFRGASYVPIDPSPSLVVLGFAFVVALITGALFGAAPAIIGSRIDPIDAIRGFGRVAGDRGSFMRRSLVSLQVALSLSLVTSAGLLAKSLDNLERQDFGFRTDGRYVAGMNIALGGAPAERLAAAYRRLPEAIGAIPGVSSVAFSLYSPMKGDNWAGRIAVEGHAAAELLISSWNRVSPRYFETIGTPLLRGRVIDDRDTPSSTRVAIVNETFARKFFVNGDAIGRHFGFADLNGAGRPDYEIVGIVGDAKYQEAREPAYPTFFLPFLQRESASSETAASGLPRSHYAGAIELHLTRPGLNLEADMRRALANVDPGLTLGRLLSLDEQVALNFNRERLIATLTVAFGGMALLLACLGLFGVTTYSVSRRTREIGVRMAMGATRARVLVTVLRGAMAQVAIGFALGVPLAVVAARLLAQQLYGVSAHDPRVLTGAAIVLGVCAALAALIPARRAALMDPQQALRDSH